MQTNVRVRPSLTFTIPISSISMSLNPASKPFDTKTIPITVGTNNESGYQVFVNATGTELVNTDDSTYTIPTLTSSGYTDANFPANYWGYKLDSGNYLPFASGNVVSSSTGPTEKTTNMTLAAKIDYLQSAGTYEIALNFSIVPVVSTNYMQTMNPSECTETPMVIADQRDGIPYKVRRLADGNCWMIENLRFTGTELSSATSNVAAQYTDANPYLINGTGEWEELDGNTASYVKGQMHIGVDNNNNPTAWYNYVAASAGTITSGVTSEAKYSICPSGWRLPTYSEQMGVLSYVDQYSPNAGGGYFGGALSYSSNGYFWSSTLTSSTEHIGWRYRLIYNIDSNTLRVQEDVPGHGFYIRCILDTQTIADATNLQDVTPAMTRNTAIGATADLVDVRDGQTYKVAKLADGKIWMLDNLRLGAIALTQSLSTTNTNMSPSTTFVLPASTNTGFTTFTTPLINTTYANTVVDTTWGIGSNKMGTYFNYCAASAGTYCMPEGSGVGNALYDVCPSGWRMPTSGSSGEYETLYEAYATKVDFKTAFSGIFSGSIRNNGFVYQNVDGTYWGSTYSTGANMRGLIIQGSDGNTIDPKRGDFARRNGFVVRCIAR
ncbi:hypothetical protein IJG92_01895 [Candidatus Saccharibacteria bacterium]|nr:hypothetical protein [Candidatus Saccharibacteria bacterium]